MTSSPQALQGELLKKESAKKIKQRNTTLEMFINENFLTQNRHGKEIKFEANLPNTRQFQFTFDGRSFFENENQNLNIKRENPKRVKKKAKRVKR